MKMFLDTANLAEIEQAVKWGAIDGVTTNPTLVAKEGGNFKERITAICRLVKGPVSAEVIATEAADMVKEARELAAIADNVVIKIPMTPDGLQAVTALQAERIQTNVTLVFSLNQALLAAKAGASYVSPFIGRLDDIGHDGVRLVADICRMIGCYGYKTEVIAASIRHPLHVAQVAAVGAHIATVPFSVLKQMFNHPLTDIGLERFLNDWRKMQEK
ncbi:MAG: fructose-6-phosphate aldolase [Firmicutes bacterium]|jgi:transaldolase|nr:fructose-6-phosphate aldolase [Bacillota bacterium]